ncbi:MAG: radical SAM protein [Gemmatimonadetes bacterium]|nr:radical SAM protein [Gemmatimonadota bacterium]
MLPLRLLPEAISRYYRVATPRRVTNAAKVGLSYALSNVLKRDIRMGRPFMLMVEPTNHCNLKCPLCPSGNGEMTRPRGHMELEHFKKVFDDLADDLLLCLLWNQGEPFLNPNLTKMIRHAADRNVPTITSTNVHYIRTAAEAEDIIQSGLSELILCLDGVDPDTYVKYRVGGDFDRVVQGIELVAEAKRRLQASTPRIHLQFILMKQNEGQVDAARQMARDFGVDRLSLKTAQVYTEEDAQIFLPTDESKSRYDYAEDGVKTKGTIKNTCRHLWYSTVVNWDGAVSPCCFDKDVHYGLGDTSNGHVFDEVWEGERYTQFRNDILKDRSAVPICNNCSEGLKGMFYDIEEVAP